MRPLPRVFARRLAAVAVVVAAAAGAGPLPAAAAAPEPPVGPPGDSFYQPPVPLPPGAPGDVLWWRPLADRLTAKAYLVLYRSQNATGAAIGVTGRVLVPKAAWRGGGVRPLVSVASGTRGIGDACAPSKWLDYEAPLIEPLLAKGWAVAITDYEGLGTPGTHTYVVGRSEGRTVIDAARAATRLPAAGLSPGGPVAFSGYSQGGGGAAWAGELAPAYAPELNVVGVAAGGTPADLVEVSKKLDGTLGFGFLLIAALGYDAAYPELNLPQYLNAKGRELYATGKDKCVDAVLGYAFQRLTDYTTSNPIARPDWQARLNQNRLGATPPRVPVLLYHGLVDQIIPLAQAETLRREYCAAGVPVQWTTYVGEHVATMPLALPQVVSYLDGRFAGRPAPNNC